MRTLELFQPTKTNTWKLKIEGLEVGTQFICSFEKMGTVRPMINRAVALCYPDRVYHTSKSNMHGVEVLVVSRLPDKV